MEEIGVFLYKYYFICRVSELRAVHLFLCNKRVKTRGSTISPVVHHRHGSLK